MKTFKALLITILLSLNLYSSDYFLDISTGYSNSPYIKKDITGSININDLDENGYLYDLAIGYRINEKLFSTLNYKYSKFYDIDYNDFYITLNYQFKHRLKPHIGVLVGKSFLHWNKVPLNNSQINNYTSESFIYGVQVGLKYLINDKLLFIPKIIYSRADHGTNLISLPSKSYVEHNSRIQILFGLRFMF